MTEQDALELLFVAGAAVGPGWHTLHVPGRDAGWLHTSNRDAFMELVPALGWDGATLSILPTRELGDPSWRTNSAVLWARTETRKSAAILRRFKPVPSLVLRDGQTCRYVAVWLIRKPVMPFDAERVNRHIAHRLGCPKKYASAEFTFRPPGGVDRSKTRPVPVVVAGGTGETYAMREVCRTLPRQIPDPLAWVNRQNELRKARA